MPSFSPVLASKKLPPYRGRGRMIEIFQIVVLEGVVHLGGDQIFDVVLRLIPRVRRGHDIKLKTMSDPQFPFFLDEDFEIERYFSCHLPASRVLLC
jgi:hypothetical protein